MPRPAPLLLACSLLLAPPLRIAPRAVRADEVALRGGSRIEGVVLEEGASGVRLLLPRGDEVHLRAEDVAAVVRDADGTPAGRILRYVEEPDGSARLDVRVVHLARPDGRRVDLVGVVHVADAAYYREVQALLEQADLVLYEAVKPRDAAMDDLTDEPSPVAAVQRMLSEWFDLRFQLEALSYDRPHFRHADLTTEELEAVMEEVGMGPAGDLLGAMSGLGRALQLVLPVLEGITKAGVAKALPRTMRLRMKRGLASALAQAATRPDALLPEAMAEVLLSRRNAVVVERLREAETGTRVVAVLYGALHLDDLERRLVEEQGLRRLGARWMTAWRIPAR